jgi:hypothetical protein
MACHLSLSRLDLLNHPICIGLATSTRQECRTKVAIKSRLDAADILQYNPRGCDEDTLRKIVSLLLCKRFHQSQRDRIVEEIMRAKSGIRTPPPNPVGRETSAAASEAAEDFIAPAEPEPVSRPRRSTRATSVTASEAAFQRPRPSPQLIVIREDFIAPAETGSRLLAPFSSPELTVDETTTFVDPETGFISRTPCLTQATSVSAADASPLTRDRCLICWKDDGGLRKCKHCSARMHPDCEEELREAGKDPNNPILGLGTKCPYW